MLLAGVLSISRLLVLKKVDASTKQRWPIGLCAATFSLWAGVASAQMWLPGSADVGQAGAAIYQIPVEIPPGTAGVQPKLSLSYNSQAGNGLMGMGWGLTGLSTVSRCPRTVAQDGVPGSVNYDTKDRFCLNGKRLIGIGGTYGGNNAKYAAEIQDFTSVASYGVSGSPTTSGPAYFKAWTKEGLILEYGNTADSKIKALANAHIRVWALNRVTDAAGNYYDVIYDGYDSNGEYWPVQIKYSGNLSTGLLPDMSVRFTYEGRTDAVSQYQGGSIIRGSKRLKSVAMYLPNSTSAFREYRIDYLYGQFTGRSRVQAIQRCDKDPSDTFQCLPAAQAAWSELPRSLPAPTEWVNGFAYPTNDTHPRLLADVTGDGKADALGFWTTGIYVSPSNGSDMPTYENWYAYLGNNSWDGGSSKLLRTFADVNGDGRSDFIGFSYSDAGFKKIMVSLAKSSGDGFVSLKEWSTDFLRSNAAPNSWDAAARAALAYTAQECGSGEHDNCQDVTKYYPDSDSLTPRYMADVNGDGLADVVGFGADGVWVAISTGSSFAPKTSWSNVFGFKDYGNAKVDYNSKTPRRFLADMNGDGMADVVEFGDDGVWVALSTGSSFGVRKQWSQGTDFAGWWSTPGRFMSVADVNGDGLNDIIANANYGTYIGVNTGTQLLPGDKWSLEFGLKGAEELSTAAFPLNWNDLDKFPITMADMNGDGMADIIGFGTTGVIVGISNGGAFVHNGPSGRWLVSQFGSHNALGWSSQKVYPRYIEDVTGDGLPDVVGFKEGVQVSTSGGLKADLMVALSNGPGPTYQFDYKALSHADAPYTKTSGAAYPLVELQGPTYVVSEARQSDGIGGLAAQTYSYEGARASWDGRGYLGFRKVISQNKQTGIERRTIYRQDFPYAGLPEQVEQWYITPATPLQLTLRKNYYTPLDEIGVGTPANGNLVDKVFAVSLIKSITQNWDLKSLGTNNWTTVSLPTVTESFTYDDFGNVTRAATLTGTGANPMVPDGFEKITNNTYSNDVPTWRIGRLLRSSVTSRTPN